VHALNRKNLLFDFWVLAFLAKFQTVVKTVWRQLPLHLAGYAAGAAARAFGGVDQHGISGHHTALFRTLTITSWTMLNAFISMSCGMATPAAAVPAATCRKVLRLMFRIPNPLFKQE